MQLRVHVKRMYTVYNTGTVQLPKAIVLHSTRYFEFSYVKKKSSSSENASEFLRANWCTLRKVGRPILETVFRVFRNLDTLWLRRTTRRVVQCTVY